MCLACSKKYNIKKENDSVIAKNLSICLFVCAILINFAVIK